MTHKVAELNALFPLDCPVVQQVRVACADYTWFFDRGYIRYFDNTKTMLREHQRVAEVAYGVPDGYHVHHADGDRLNNRAANLVVLSPSEHLRLHGVGYTRRAVVMCATCGNPFETQLRNVIERNARFCSERCRALGSRKVARPSADQLSELLQSVGNWRTLGQMFGVSDNAVRKWAKQYALDLSVCDGRRK